MFNYATVITNDTRSSGEDKDLYINTTQKILKELHCQCAYENILPDDKDRFRKELIYLTDQEEVNLVITSGGTGLAPRDVTPDATLGIIHRQVPGILMAMLLASEGKTPMWMLSRVVAEVRDQTLIISLPDSPKAVEKCLIAISQTLFHGLEIINNIVKQH